MTYLLDTHTLLWLVLESPKLGSETRKLLENAGREDVFISVICFAEIEIKIAVGKLKAARNVQETILAKNPLTLPLSTEQVSSLRGLPLIHRDPFDRILIAQAMSERMTLITGDRVILKYPGVKLLDASK